MPTTTADLWPDDIAVEVLSPVMILKQQAEAISKKTKGLVKGDVRKISIENSEEIAFDLLAPALGLREELLTVRYKRGYPYPSSVSAAALEGSLRLQSPQTPTNWEILEPENPCEVAYTPVEFLTILRKVFGARDTLAVISSILARSNEANEGVRNNLTPPSGD